eukprot:15446586-Alexandrium_andersonii.AAC.1
MSANERPSGWQPGQPGRPMEACASRDQHRGPELVHRHDPSPGHEQDLRRLGCSNDRRSRRP